MARLARQAIPDYLSNKIESIQRRAFRIILPLTESYDEALMLAQIPTLESRREYLCKEYILLYIDKKKRQRTSNSNI